MKYKYVKKDVKVAHNCYGYMVKTGDVADLPDNLVAKAETNPDWEKADVKAKATVKPDKPSAEEVQQTTDEVTKALTQENAALKEENSKLTARVKRLEQQQ